MHKIYRRDVGNWFTFDVEESRFERQVNEKEILQMKSYTDRAELFHWEKGRNNVLPNSIVDKKLRLVDVTTQYTLLTFHWGSSSLVLAVLKFSMHFSASIKTRGQIRRDCKINRSTSIEVIGNYPRVVVICKEREVRRRAFGKRDDWVEKTCQFH